MGMRAEMVVMIQPVRENGTGQDTKRKRASERYSLAGEGSSIVTGCCDWDSFFCCAGSNGSRGQKDFSITQ